jgi:hypothetical protein
MNINGATRASIETSIIQNMSRESLMEIAPAVQQLSEMDLLQLTGRGTNGLSTEADRLLDQIRRVLGRYAPTDSSRNHSRGVAGRFPQWVHDAMMTSFQQADRNVAPGQRVGFGGFFNLETGEHIRFNSEEERRAHMTQGQRQSDQSMVNQLRDRINSLNTSGNNIDETV